MFNKPNKVEMIEQSWDRKEERKMGNSVNTFTACKPSNRILYQELWREGGVKMAEE